MTAQVQARQTLARLRARGQRANSPTDALAPGKLTSKDEFRLVRSWPLDKVRDLARGQLERTKAALEQASGVAWYTLLYTRVMNHIRWEPFFKEVEAAEETFKRAEASPTDSEKKERYISAWAQARLALAHIAEEANFGETGFVYLAEDLARAVAEAAKPYVDSAREGIGSLGWLLFGLGVLQLVRR